MDEAGPCNTLVAGTSDSAVMQSSLIEGPLNMSEGSKLVTGRPGGNGSDTAEL